MAAPAQVVSSPERNGAYNKLHLLECNLEVAHRKRGRGERERWWQGNSSYTDMSSDVGVCQLHKNANSYVAGHANSVQDMQRRRNGNGAERKRQWQRTEGQAGTQGVRGN